MSYMLSDYAPCSYHHIWENSIITSPWKILVTGCIPCSNTKHSNSLQVVIYVIIFLDSAQWSISMYAMFDSSPVTQSKHWIDCILYSLNWSGNSFCSYWEFNFWNLTTSCDFQIFLGNSNPGKVQSQLPASLCFHSFIASIAHWLQTPIEWLSFLLLELGAAFHKIVFHQFLT